MYDGEKGFVVEIYLRREEKDIYLGLQSAGHQLQVP